MTFDSLAAHEASRVGVHRTTLIKAIEEGTCGGEEREGRWYTSRSAADDWYNQHYRLRGTPHALVAGKTWSDHEISRLLELLTVGKTIQEIARELKRAENSVSVKISKLRREGIAPSASASKRARARVLAAEEEGPDHARERQRLQRKGRPGIHLSPMATDILGHAAEAAGLHLSEWITYIGLAAVADPKILKAGLREAEKLGMIPTSPEETGAG